MTLNNNKIKEYDVIIIGGGPAGLSTWFYLNLKAPEIATRTLLIEKEKYPRDKICGGALGGWTEKILNQLDINIDIPSVDINTVECRLGEKVIQINQKNFFRIIRRIEFDQALVQIAKKRGLRIQENETFSDFKRNKQNIYIHTDKNIYKSKILIGADGALSSVRRKMNPNIKPILAPGLEIFNPVDLTYDSEFNEKKVVLDFSLIKKGLQGYVWHFPCIMNNTPTINHGIVDFCISSKKPKINIKDMLSQELKLRNINTTYQSWRGHPIPWFNYDADIAQPNILLVGDSAGIEPAIGSGIHLALSYGEVASFSIVQALQKNDYSFIDYKTLIQSHILGKYIKKLTELSKIMYSDSNKTLDVVSKIFFQK